MGGFKYKPTKVFCKYCNKWVYNNAVCRNEHDSSDYHKNNVKRYISKEKTEKLNKQIEEEKTKQLIRTLQAKSKQSEAADRAYFSESNQSSSYGPSNQYSSSSVASSYSKPPDTYASIGNNVTAGSYGQSYSPMSYSDMTTYHPYMPTTILTTGAPPAPMGTAVPPPPPPPLPMNYYMNTIGYYNPTMGYPMQDIHYSETSVQKAKDVVEQAVPSISTQSIAISTEKKEEKEQTNEESDDPFGDWSTVEVKTVDKQELQKRDHAYERALTKNDESKKKEEESSSDSSREEKAEDDDNEDDAMNTYNPYGGNYKGVDLSSNRVKKSVALFNLDPVDTPSLSSIKSKKEKTEVTKNESEEHSSENEEENKNKEQIKKMKIEFKQIKKVTEKKRTNVFQSYYQDD